MSLGRALLTRSMLLHVPESFEEKQAPVPRRPSSSDSLRRQMSKGKSVGAMLAIKLF